MSEQYEWDKTGEPSKDLLRLESVMSTLRYDEPLAESTRVAKPASARWLGFAVAAVMLIGIGAALWSRTKAKARPEALAQCTKASSADDAWSVTVLSGAPLCGNQPIEAPASLQVGTAVETDKSSKVEIQVADIGNVVLEPNSRLALQTSSVYEHRMKLDYGTLRAQIDAPPRIFLVQTPAALAVDLGCEYTLTVAPEGETHLHVTHGYVSLENGGEPIYVPAGYKSNSFPGVGTSVPYAAGASNDLVKATRDLALAPSGHALAALLRSSTGPRDTLGLWHLLASPDYCEATVRRLRELVEVDPDPMGLGWGTCSDAARKNAWQSVLEPFWEKLTFFVNGVLVCASCS